MRVSLIAAVHGDANGFPYGVGRIGVCARSQGHPRRLSLAVRGRRWKEGRIVDALSKLPDAMDELLDGFMTHAIVGDTTVGLN